MTNNYGFSYMQSDAIPISPEKYLELKQKYPQLKVLRIIPPTFEEGDFGKIVVLASSMKKED